MVSDSNVPCLWASQVGHRWPVGARWSQDFPRQALWLGQVMMPSQVVAGQSWNRAENGENGEKNRWISGNSRKSFEIYMVRGIKHGEKSWEILDGFNSMLFMFIPKQIFFPRNSPVIYSWRFFSRYIYELIGNFLKQKPSIFRMRWGVLDLFPPIHWAFSIW